jgi:transcriptional regulator of acetoin/glycerol metabolism
VAAAHDDLRAALRECRLRRDLYQRLAGVVIELPRLAHRPEDLMPLAQHFASLDRRTLEPGVDAVLHGYAWPGNVRELRLAIERAGYLVENGSLSAVAVAQAIALGQEGAGDQHRSLDDIITAGVATGWNAARMATDLGIHRATLFRRLSSYGLALRSLRESHESRDSRATDATAGARVVP